MKEQKATGLTRMMVLLWLSTGRSGQTVEVASDVDDPTAADDAELIGVATASPGDEDSCPANCDCFNSYETVDCSRRGLQVLPTLHNATRRLYLEDNRLVSLDSGLRDAVQLTLLIAERNAIERIDVAQSFCGLTRIQELNVAANRIRSFDVPDGGTRSTEDTVDAVNRCRAPALKELNLSLNLLTTVPRNLSEFAPNLEILNLSYNEISAATLDLSYSAMTALRYLDLSRNRIHELAGTDFDAVISGGVPLEILSLVECGLVSIEPDALAELVNVTSLGLANNPLQQDTLTTALARVGRRPTADNVSSAVNEFFDDYSTGHRCKISSSELIRLDISEVILSNLTVEAVGGFSRLVVLDASYCELQHIEPQLFDCLPDLETLHLEGGRLEQLDNLRAVRRLKRLHLQENRLASAVDITGLDRLEFIDLSRNRIETVPSRWLAGDTRGLQIVNLSHNLIHAIEHDAFHQVTVTSTLDLSFNRLTHVDQCGLAGVGRLDISYNVIEKVADDALTGLHHSLAELDLGYNRLTRIAAPVLRHARELLVLDLRHNYLGPKFGLDRSESATGTDADASSPNSFSASWNGNAFQDLESLESLDLSDNGLEELDCRLMTSLPHLLSLNLRGNEFTDLRYASIACCSPTLVRLDVSANRLNVVDVLSLRGLDRLSELDAADNPFDCSECVQTLFVRWANRSAGVRLDQRERLLCASPPPPLAGPSVFDAVADCPPTVGAEALTDPTRPAPNEARLSPAAAAALLTTVVGVLAVVAVSVGVVCRYRRLFPRLKSLHWQVRYREVSDLETNLAAHNPLFHAADT